MQYSQEHLKTMVYAKFGGQTECIMGNWKIENSPEVSMNRPNSLILHTLICNTSIESHPNFLQNIFLCCWKDLLPFFIAIILSVQYFEPVTCIEKLRAWGLSWGLDLSVGKKRSRLRLCFRVVDNVTEKKGMELLKQFSSGKLRIHVF